MEKVTFYSSQVFLSENNTNPNSYIAKFIICDFHRNKNGVALNRNKIEDWLDTLKNQPLVGKIVVRYDGECDFSGHNCKVVKKKDENGNEYQEVEFDTNAFGTFVDVGIETIDETEYIVATCEIWKRFSKACEIILNRIQNGNLSTSWEISVEKYSSGIIDGLMTKIIDCGRFIGHCLLGKNVEPAFDSSGLVEISSCNYDFEFAEAISKDIISQQIDEKSNAEKEEKELEKTGKKIETPETSQLSDRDIKLKIEEEYEKTTKKYAIVVMFLPNENEAWLRDWDCESQLDMVQIKYAIENDVLTITETNAVKLSVSISEINKTIENLNNEISEKDECVVKMGKEIGELKSEIEDLKSYKENFEKAEQEKQAQELANKQAELSEYVLTSGLITKEELETSSELKEYISNLDKKSINSIIAERYMNKLKDSSKIETSEIIDKTPNIDNSPKSNLNDLEDNKYDIKSIMNTYLNV